MNQFSLAFPEGAAVCAAGDYLLCRRPGEAWRVYRVEDILTVKRLVPVVDDPSTLMLEEHLLDSVTPAYHEEVQLLLTAFDPTFDDEPEALQAVRQQTLHERERGLLRPARELNAPDCRAVRTADTA